MRNLRNIRYDVCHDATGATAACWDAGQDEVIAAFGPSEDEPKVRLTRVVDRSELTCHDFASWDALSPNPDMVVDRIVSLHYFGDLATVCVIMAGGDIVMAREETSGSYEPVHIEIVGSVDPGIAAARWSPDEEVLALVTTGGNLILMSRAFETIGETPLTPADLAASKHVSVGWGKKETQFKGRGAAKAMRDPTIPEMVDDGTLSPADDASAVTISWRGDGEYVAVNAVEAIVEGGDDAANSPETKTKRRRVVRVYNREGVLDSASEPVDGLESYLSWRPSGNLLATVQRKPGGSHPDQFNIIFFERNGLRHGQFELRLPSTGAGTGPVGLDWNTDSTVLAITYGSEVQFWTMGNYHWYLKQEIVTRSQRPLTVWHPEKPLRLVTSTFDGLASAEYVFCTARGTLTPPNDHGSVAVIDGKSIKLTPLRATNMPPPMSLFELPTSLPAIDVAFSPKDDALAVLTSSGLEVFSWTWPATAKRSPQPTLAASLSFAHDANFVGFVPLEVCFIQGSKYAVYVLGWDALSRTQIRSFVLDREGGQLAPTDPVSVARGSILATAHQGRDLYTQDPSGALTQLNAEAPSAFPFRAKLPSLLPWVEVVESGESGPQFAIGLSRNGHLYANERQLTKNCTSFVVTDDHLVFTTSNHLLKFVHLTDVHDLEIPLDDPEADERCRSIEQGARLVTSIPSNLCVVLQMPRGNLETIFPRAMVVAGIRKLIDALDYGKAFAFCRSQRVDMNILYDHTPQQFLANVDLFLDQLNDVASIDLFLSSLKEEDVSQTMYKDTKKTSTATPFRLPQLVPPTPAPASASSTKVNTVCDAVLARLATRKKTNLQNIITAHVSKLPPAIDDGLTVVAQLLHANDTAAARTVSAKAVEHICFLVDVNQLYDHALGLYDLDLTIAIAQQSQRDPKEYVPFIRTLHEMSPTWRKFSIDDHLERHEKALSHLADFDDFNEFLQYTNKHRLYKKALGIYRYNTERHSAITNAYAEYLVTQSKFREAGLAYESLQNFSKAASCYQSAGVSCWRECLFAAQSQTPPLSSDVFSELTSNLVDALLEARDYTAAAKIQLEYLASVEGVRTLCKAYEFAEAMRVTARLGRADLLQTHVDPGLGDALSSSTELLADCRSQLKAQVPRILELRQKAIEDPLGFYEGERLGGEDVPDDVSIAASSRISTSASLFTRYSTGTAATGKTGETGGTGTTQQHRNRKKREEKKRARGRKGTVYEQEYLINSVRRLVERVERARPEVERLVVGLTRRDMAERARAIEALMAELIEACQAAIREVWQQPAFVGGQTAPAMATLSVENANGQSQDNGGDAAPANNNTTPWIAGFERLSLLG
ncbi:elongator complex protein 1 [Sporothrix brasiliensis 5110]|uniref:Elongator complex protein 1 n=1 Tax=Sporothrix brasiliensis 5110 TaxID=1398154 RepID=A0A0C2J1R8_9PEZI|nr:elongator complex protein 1 [Sporothrix brasiliensis 5110]KIH95256.1 elongator complex protein 1 [Sporothrix brasiliensis 5110]